LLTAVGS
jgi:hypothetical protein